MMRFGIVLTLFGASVFAQGCIKKIPPPPLKPNVGVNIIDEEIEMDEDTKELWKKGIEVLDGGLFNSRKEGGMTLKINGKKYTVRYKYNVEVYLDSLRSLRSIDDIYGTHASQDIIDLVKENSELIAKLGARLSRSY